MAELQSSADGRRLALRRSAAAGLVLCLTASSAAVAQSDPEPGYATQPFTPKTFTMPDGQGCAGDVARWEAVQENDYASGNIGLKIYHQIKQEIARADAACRAGHDREARAMIGASKRRHGYPG